jgi:hypothetical protein
MTDEHGDQWESEPTWQEKREMARALREHKKARLTRSVEDVKARAGISQLAKRLRVNVADVIGKPPPKLPEVLDDQESNARERMLKVQAETVRAQYAMTDEQFEARKKELEKQKAQLLERARASAGDKD